MKRIVIGFSAVGLLLAGCSDSEPEVPAWAATLAEEACKDKLRAMVPESKEFVGRTGVFGTAESGWVINGIVGVPNVPGLGSQQGWSCSVSWDREAASASGASVQLLRPGRDR